MTKIDDNAIGYDPYFAATTKSVDTNYRVDRDRITSKKYAKEFLVTENKSQRGVQSPL